MNLPLHDSFVHLNCTYRCEHLCINCSDLTLSYEKFRSLLCLIKNHEFHLTPEFFYSIYNTSLTSFVLYKDKSKNK